MFRRTEISLATATNGRPDFPACSVFTVPTELAPVSYHRDTPVGLHLLRDYNATFQEQVILGAGFVSTVRCNDEH